MPSPFFIHGVFMDITKLDIAHLENIIRLIKRQKQDSLEWQEIRAFGASLHWLDGFHDRATADLNDKTAPIKIDVTPKSSKSKKKRKR